jgi:hypothetical protein
MSKTGYDTVDINKSRQNTNFQGLFVQFLPYKVHQKGKNTIRIDDGPITRWGVCASRCVCTYIGVHYSMQLWNPLRMGFELDSPPSCAVPIAVTPCERGATSSTFKWLTSTHSPLRQPVESGLDGSPCKQAGAVHVLAKNSAPNEHRALRGHVGHLGFRALQVSRPCAMKKRLTRFHCW